MLQKSPQLWNVEFLLDRKVMIWVISVSSFATQIVYI